MGGDWGRGAFGCGVGTWSYGRAHRVVTVSTRGDAMRDQRAAEILNARVPPRREGQKKPQVFGGLVRQNAHLPALDGHTLAHHGGCLGRL